MSNAQQAKAYREKLKADPEKVAMLRSKAAERMRKMRAAQKSGAQHGAQQPCEPSVSTPVSTPSPRKPTPEERAALLAAFDDVALQEPVALLNHPFIKLVQTTIPCTFVKELEPKHPKPFNNSANQLPRLPGESTISLSLRRNRAWYEDNRERLTGICQNHPV